MINQEPFVSNQVGEARVFTSATCGSDLFEIAAEAPDGFGLTNSARLTVPKDFDPEHRYSFGLASLPGFPTPTPPPAPPVCQAYPLGQPKEHALTGLAAAPDGTLWAATWGLGAARYDPAADRWIWLTAEDGLLSSYIHAITIEPDGRMWFATNQGVSVLDGEQWTHYTASDGLVSSYVHRVALDEKGTAWFATDEGVSRLELDTGQWQSYTTDDGLPDPYVKTIAIAANGKVWVSALGELATLAADTNTDHWQVSETLGNMPFVDRILATPDGGLWFAGMDGLAVRGSKTFGSQDFDGSNTQGAFQGSARSLALAPDGSLWIGNKNDRPRLYHLIPAQDGSGPDRWQIFNARDGLPSTPALESIDDGVVDRAAVSNQTIWLATPMYVVRCIFPEQ